MRESMDKQRLILEQCRIVAEIKNLQRRAEPLNIAAVKRRHPELLESVYKIEPFWGWKQALEAADIACTKIRVELLDYVTCEICHKEFASLTSHLRKKHEVLPEDYQIDYPDAEIICELSRAKHTRRRKFKNGLPDWEPLWSKEYVLDKVWEYRKSGYPINLHAVKLTEKRLYRACKKYFPSWDEMLRTLGLDPQEVRRNRICPYRSAKDVVHAIQRRHSRGQPINHHALGRNKPAGNRLLLVKAKKFFGSWGAAVEAAGIPYSTIFRNREYPTADAVLKEIARRNRLELGLNYTIVHEQDHALYGNAVRMFGSWRAAITAARLDYERIRKDKGPRLSTRKYPDKIATIRVIREREESGLSLCPRKLSPALKFAARRFFGEWKRALQAAGVWRAYKARREMIKRKRIAAALRQGKYPSRESVVKALRQRDRQGLPVNGGAVDRGAHADPALYRAGMRFYRHEWSKALRAAGFNPRKMQKPNSTGGGAGTRQAGMCFRRSTAGRSSSFPLILPRYRRESTTMPHCFAPEPSTLAHGPQHSRAPAWIPWQSVWRAFG